MGKITENFTPAEINRLRDDFIGNEAGTDEYRETQPDKTFWYLHALGEDKTSKHRHEIMRAVAKWANGYVRDLDERSTWDAYAGADDWGDIGKLIFDIHLEHDEHPYLGSDLDAIREELSDTE